MGPQGHMSADLLLLCEKNRLATTAAIAAASIYGARDSMLRTRQVLSMNHLISSPNLYGTGTVITPF